MQDPTRLLQRDGVVMMVLVEMMVWMMVMIPMKPSLMTVLMVTVSPLREGIPPGRNLFAGEIFLSRCFPPPRGGRNLYLVAPSVLGFRRKDIGKGEDSEAGQVGHTCPRRGSGGPAPRGVWAPLRPFSVPPFGFLRLLVK